MGIITILYAGTVDAMLWLIPAERTRSLPHPSFSPSLPPYIGIDGIIYGYTSSDEAN